MRRFFVLLLLSSPSCSLSGPVPDAEPSRLTPATEGGPVEDAARGADEEAELEDAGAGTGACAGATF